MEEKALLFVEIAGGIVLGFIVFSFVAPMLSPSAATPTA